MENNGSNDLNMYNNLVSDMVKQERKCRAVDSLLGRS